MLKNTTGIAYRAARMLGMNTGDLDVAQISHGTIPTKITERESLRRCFWAAWTTNCINADHYDLNTSPDSRVMQVPLPVSGAAFREALAEDQGQLSLTDKSPLLPQHWQRTCEISVMAELLKLVLRWSILLRFNADFS